MPERESRRIAIVGAGIGGLAAGIALQRGFQVGIYEQAAELAEIGTTGRADAR